VPSVQRDLSGGTPAKQTERQTERQTSATPRRRRRRQQRQESDRAMSSSSKGPRTPRSPQSGGDDDCGEEQREAQLAAGRDVERDEGDPSASDASAQRSLREWRITKGMTQQQVAFASGLGITSVRDIERERRVPTIVTARKLVRALGITLEQVRWPEERYPAHTNLVDE